MHKYLAAKIFLVFIFLAIFCSGIAALRSGKIRSRGHRFDRDEDPVGYWLTVIVTLAGPIVIVYLLFTR